MLNTCRRSPYPAAFFPEPRCEHFFPGNVLQMQNAAALGSGSPPRSKSSSPVVSEERTSLMNADLEKQKD